MIQRRSYSVTTVFLFSLLTFSHALLVILRYSRLLFCFCLSACLPSIYPAILTSIVPLWYSLRHQRTIHVDSSFLFDADRNRDVFSARSSSILAEAQSMHISLIPETPFKCTSSGPTSLGTDSRAAIQKAHVHQGPCEWCVSPGTK